VSQPQPARQRRSQQISTTRRDASALEEATWRMITGRPGALAGARAVLAADPRHVRAHAVVGAGRWLDGDLVGSVEALSLAARTASRVPRRRDRQLVEVVCALAGGSVDRAGLVARGHAADFPDEVLVPALLSRAAELGGDRRVWCVVDELVRAAEPSVAASSSVRLADALVALAALGAAGRADPTALGSAEEALARDPGSGTAAHALVHALEALGKPHAARRASTVWLGAHRPAPWLGRHLLGHARRAA
jgi:hypothetical protein